MSALFAVEKIEIGIAEDFSKLIKNPIDNQTSFGILIWEGNAQGQNRHSTRLDSVVDGITLSLLDTTRPNGEIREYSQNELSGASPLGFTFLRLVK